MKRRRREEDEETAFSIRVQHLANEEDFETLQAQIVAAVNEKNYSEAMKLSAEACLLQRSTFESNIMAVDTAGGRQDHHIAAGDKGIKSKENAPCKLSKREKTAFNRVIASLETGLIATIGAMRQLDLAKTYYEKYCDSEAKAVFKLATQRVKGIISPAVIYDQIEEVKTAWKVSAIFKLNNDVLLEIFDYVDTEDMLNCWRVNQHWCQLLAKPLQQKTLELEGTVEEIDEQWRRYGGAMQRAGVTSLDVFFKGNEFVDYIGHYHGHGSDHINEVRKRKHDEIVASRFKYSSLYQKFPFKTLEKVFVCSDNLALDVPLWRCLRSCKRLKAIQWAFTYGYEDAIDSDSIAVPDFKVAGSSLAECHLEYIDIEASKEFRMEKDFNNLCKAARICRIIVEAEKEVEIDSD